MAQNKHWDGFKSLLFMIWVLWIPMLFTLPFLAIGLILKGIRLTKAGNRFIYHSVNIWSNYIYRSAGGKLEVVGLENVPKNESICFISNHQGLFDILILIAAIPIRVGFVAKKSLMNLPFFAQWMMAIGCVFIDRKNLKNARKSINKGVESIKRGNSLIIFPEGTRSRGPKLGDFRKGSLKLALKSDATIIPVSINGTFRLFEESNCIHGGPMKIVIHKPIRPEDLTQERKVHLMEEIRDMVASGLVE